VLWEDAAVTLMMNETVQSHWPPQEPVR